MAFDLTFRCDLIKIDQHTLFIYEFFRFKAIDKIKTVGSTYMAAVGLMPDLRILNDDDTTAGIHLSTLVEFVFAMRDRLLNINENSYNNFMLRVGEFHHNNRNKS